MGGVIFMNECPTINSCSFANSCMKTDPDNSVKELLNLYCKGDQHNDCVRKMLTDTFNVTVVPNSMMPNGLPLPGTFKENWSEEALNYRSYF